MSPDIIHEQIVLAVGNKPIMTIRGRAAGVSIGLSNISERVPNLLDDMRMLWSFYCVLCNSFNLVWLSFLRHVQMPHLQQTLEGTASTSYTSKLGSLSFGFHLECVFTPHTILGLVGLESVLRSSVCLCGSCPIILSAEGIPAVVLFECSAVSS